VKGQTNRTIIGKGNHKNIIPVEQVKVEHAEKAIMAGIFKNNHCMQDKSPQTKQPSLQTK